MKNDIIKQIFAKRKNVRVEITLYKDNEGSSVFIIRTKRLTKIGKIIKSELYLRPETFLMLEKLLPLFLENDTTAKLQIIDSLAEAQVTKTKLYKYQNPELYK